MNFWNTLYFGNPLKDWLIALAIILVAFSLIKLLKEPVVKMLKSWSGKTSNSIDNFIVLAIETTIVPVLYFAAIFFALQYLTFNEHINRIIHVATLLIITFFILRIISAGIQYSIFTFLEKKEDSEIKQKQAKGLIIILKATIWVLGFVFLLDNLGYNVTTIITGLGIGGIAIALAAQTILGDIFSYFVIFFDRPFEIGDFIEVDDKKGTVEYIGIKTTRLRAIGGEQLIFSNKDLTESRVHNNKRMVKRRIAFTIGVIYQTPVEKIKKIPAIIKEIIDRKMHTEFDRSNFSGFGNSSLNFETIYFIKNGEFTDYMDEQEKIYIELFEAFETEKIEFAYPTQTLFAANSFDKNAITPDTNTLS